MRRIHVIGIGAGDPGYVTAQAVDALNDVDVFFASDKGDGEGRPGGAAAARSASGSSANPAIASSSCPTRSGPRKLRRCRLPPGRRRLARRPRRTVGAGASRRTGRRRGRRVPGVGRSVVVRQHVAHPRHGRRSRRVHLRRHPRHHRDPGAHRATPHPAQRRRRTGAHHHRPTAARGGVCRRRGGDARRRLRVPRTARRRPRSGGAPTSARPTSCSSRAPSARSASGSPRSAPRPATGTAGSWTPTCCGPDATAVAGSAHGSVSVARRGSPVWRCGSSRCSCRASASSAATRRCRGSASSSSWR